LGRWFCRRKVELHQAAPDLLHGDPFGFVRLSITLVRRVIQPGPSAPPELFGPKSRDVDKEEAIRYRGRRLDDFLSLDDLLLRGRLNIHKRNRIHQDESQGLKAEG
jgi:hypothetical protein